MIITDWMLFLLLAISAFCGYLVRMATEPK